MTLEEKIARVIDATPFAIGEATLAHLDADVRQLWVQRRNHAIAKADAILSLLPNTGEREKALEEMEERAKELEESGERQAAAELEYWIEKFSTIKNTNAGEKSNG